MKPTLNAFITTFGKLEGEKIKISSSFQQEFGMKKEQYKQQST